MARKTKAEAERTRLRILKAALDLFVEKGYERATFEDVARRIGLTKGAVYWHFKSKHELLTTLVAHMTALHTEQLSGVLPPPDSLDGLKAHFIARAKLIAEKPTNRKFFHMMMRLDWPSAKFAPLKQQIRQLETGPFFIIERTLDQLQRTGAVRADVDVKAVTAILGAMWLGLINHAVGKCLDVGLEQAVGSGFDAVIDSIRA